jgi:hypothetical protein
LPEANSLHPGAVPQRGTRGSYVRVPNSRSGGHEFESPVRQELGALTKKWKDPWGQVFLQWLVTPTCCLSTWLVWLHDHVSLSGCITLTAWHSLAWQTHLPDATAELCKTCSWACHWQTHLPGRLTCPTPLLYTQVQYPNVVLQVFLHFFHFYHRF